MNYNQLLTPWAKDNCPLSEYPRPQFVRDSYLCLNGKWQYAITDSADIPSQYQGDIVVPFSPESVLSGVNKQLGVDQYLHYHRVVNIPKSFVRDICLLHFGAVDNICHVYVNGNKATSHVGGFNSFCCDITPYLVEGDNTLDVVVSDSIDLSPLGYANGKQSSTRGGIWYTPQSGIWQTVWLESVPSQYIRGIKITPNYDDSSVTIAMDKVGVDNVTITITSGDQQVAKVDTADSQITIALSDFVSWSPENPHLYDIQLISRRDTITSYFGMRKFSLIRDNKGYLRTALNNKPYFHNGLLDQGYWSDGMLTAPSDQALIYDIQLAKDMGFNMLRKHIKVESMRWYYHCDRLGMIVWQDMPSGGTRQNKLYTLYLPMLGKQNIKDNKYNKFGRKSQIGRDIFKQQYIDMISQLYNCVSIAVWVPFNEGWGQFDSVEYDQLTRQLDSTRLVDHASGWHDQGAGDFKSLHVYFKPVRLPKDNKRAVILSEFGGYCYKDINHSYNINKTFAYKILPDKESFTQSVAKLYQKDVIAKISKGLTAAVYTQISDVEDEVNGLLTYDRQVVKIDVDKMKEINNKVKL